MTKMEQSLLIFSLGKEMMMMKLLLDLVVVFGFFQRATTYYLADRRYDMLPSVLSADLCSLLQGVDRSVDFPSYFQRCQLAYFHVLLV